APPRPESISATGIGMVLADVSNNLMAGLIELVAGRPYNGKADLPVIASALSMPADDLFPIGETLQMLRFAVVEGGDIQLLDAGPRSAPPKPDARRPLSAPLLPASVPPPAHSGGGPEEGASHIARKSRFLDELEDYMNTEDAERTLRAVIDW